MGQTVALVVIHNVGLTPCTLDGYPGLAAETSSHARIQLRVRDLAPGQRAGAVSGVSPQLVVIGVGQQASFRLAYGDTPVGSAQCPDVAQLLVTPPNGLHSVAAAQGLPPSVCTSVAVQAIQAGTAAS
ncbi:MAG: DUF4232 domain-containing protein [Actinomycetota bacterium]|nr:DUF4232 domain-containing protein [Actinomycetota bacterium]